MMCGYAKAASCRFVSYELLPFVASVYLCSTLSVYYVVPCRKIQYYAILTPILNYYNISLNVISVTIMAS
jgi:hypothetical protein